MDNISLTDEAGAFVTMGHDVVEGGMHQLLALLKDMDTISLTDEAGKRLLRSNCFWALPTVAGACRC